jgi:hypothetical protein
MFMQDFGKLSTELASGGPRMPANSPAPVVSGLVAGTLVEGAQGWCRVETLTIGDRVQTLDGGLARILGMDRRQLPVAAETALILVPGGCHDACTDLLLVPGQHVVVDTFGEVDFGAPFAMMPAVALTTDPRVRRHFPVSRIEIVTLMFADEEVVYANSGVLLHCPGVMDGPGRYPDNSFFPRLDIAEARCFLQRRSARLSA